MDRFDRPVLTSARYVQGPGRERARRSRKELGRSCASDEAIAQRCFEFVRDSIKHSWDLHLEGPGGTGLPVTCRASDALLHRTGFCYSKSHLLAALLRVNGLPAGLCYQRLTVGRQGPPYCLHGLDAVYLERHGWYQGETAVVTEPSLRLDIDALYAIVAGKV